VAFGFPSTGDFSYPGGRIMAILPSGYRSDFDATLAKIPAILPGGYTKVLDSF
jgi:hypothetical protein